VNNYESKHHQIITNIVWATASKKKDAKTKAAFDMVTNALKIAVASPVIRSEVSSPCSPPAESSSSPTDLTVTGSPGDLSGIEGDMSDVPNPISKLLETCGRYQIPSPNYEVSIAY